MYDTVIHRSECSENDFKGEVNTFFLSLSLFCSSSISLPERLITLTETNGSRYDYEGRGEIVPVDAKCTTSDVTDVIFFSVLESRPHGRKGRRGRE